MTCDEPVSPEYARFLLESAGWTPQEASAITYSLLERSTHLTIARLGDANNAARRVVIGRDSDG